MNEAINISVITICFNNAEELIKTMASVDAQNNLPFEHIIVDGSTNSRIADYLRSHPQPVYRKWISEADKGIADAFNKGVGMATGSIVNMLNAGDSYVDGSVLNTVQEKFTKDGSLAWLHGKFTLLRGGIWVTIGKPFDAALLYRGMRSLSHQSMFVKRALHEKYGVYDITLKNAMDYDFVCRIASEKFLFISQPLIVFAPGGTTDINYLQALKEGKQVYQKHFGKSLALELWQLRLKSLHFLLKGPAGKFLYRLKVWMKLENA